MLAQEIEIAFRKKGTAAVVRESGDRVHECGDKGVGMSRLRVLAEAIILQAFEDLWDVGHRGESLEFFQRSGFQCYAELAGISCDDQQRLLGMMGLDTGDIRMRRRHEI